jgi:hypothetical protein
MINVGWISWIKQSACKLIQRGNGNLIQYLVRLSMTLRMLQQAIKKLRCMQYAFIFADFSKQL